MKVSPITSDEVYKSPKVEEEQKAYESDESSELFENDNEDDLSSLGTTSKRSRKKAKPIVSKLIQQRNEIRAKAVKEVMEKVMPDLGQYDIDGMTNIRKESDAGAMFIAWLKFLGCLDMDIHDAVLSGTLYKVRGSIQKYVLGPEGNPNLINQYNENGYTPLSLAVKIDNEEIVECLLDHHAEPDIIDESSGRTPLFFSVQVGNHSITKLLLRHHASVNMPDFKCITPLMIAASLNDVKHCEILCTKFAELDIQDENGWTALHYGAMTNAVAAVRFLVEQGANKNLRDRNKRKPLHLAKFKNFGECIAVLASTTKVLV
eukprot:gene1791-1956_t